MPDRSTLRRIVWRLGPHEREVAKPRIECGRLLTERSPWLIYAVLGVASLALFVVLWRLARTIAPEK